METVYNQRKLSKDKQERHMSSKASTSLISRFIVSVYCDDYDINNLETFDSFFKYKRTFLKYERTAWYNIESLNYKYS